MNVQKLQQDIAFVNHCYRVPNEFNTEIVIDEAAGLQDALMMTACAFSDMVVGNDHLLDGYSWTNVILIREGKLQISQKKVDPDEETRIREREGCYKPKVYGIFTGVTPWWKKLFCCGRLGVLATTGRIIERPTAHQPIFYPPRNEVLFPSTLTYPTFKIATFPDLAFHEYGGRSESFFESVFHQTSGKNVYTCMHPCYDYSTDSLLTYTFLHSKILNKTTIWFYEFKSSSDTPKPVKFIVPQKATLHMFGFTKKYFVLFTCSLHLKKCGTASLICGTPVFRALDDDYCGNLFIHLIPRDGRGSTVSIDTRQKGFIYHSINCFDFGDDVIVDAFVSKSNGSREASQFELGEEPVYENEGDPFRFHISLPTSGEKNIMEKLMVSVLDSSLDFHCINPRHAGLNYHDWYMTAHKRHRNLETGVIELVESILYHIRIVPRVHEDPLSFDPTETLVESISSTSWSDRSVYLRTPIFVPRLNPKSENDGMVFAWSYESTIRGVGLDGKLLLFTSDLELVRSISFAPNIIPYSIHSYPHLFNYVDKSKTDEIEEL